MSEYYSSTITQLYNRVVGELDSVIHKADLYVSENVEDSEGFLEWDGERVGNEEWEYAFWELLDRL